MSRHEGLSLLAGVDVQVEDDHLDLPWDAWKSQWVVYTIADLDGPYYVGLASDLRRRLNEHRRAGLTMRAYEVTTMLVESQAAAQRLEAHWISLLRPSQNLAKPRLSAIDGWWYDRLRSIYEGTSDLRQAFRYCPTTGDVFVTLVGSEVEIPAFPPIHTDGLDWWERRWSQAPHWYPDSDGEQWKNVWSWIARRLFPWLR